MDESVDLRSLKEIQDIAAYLRNMKIRHKAFGGCDPESVLSHLYEITLQYETLIAGLLSQGNRQRERELQARLSQLERENAEFARWQQGMVRWYEESIRSAL